MSGKIRTSHPHRFHPLMSRLAKRRTAMHMTQDELADIIGWCPSHISKWETGHSSPRLQQVEEWAQGLGLQLVWRLEPIGQDARAASPATTLAATFPKLSGDPSQPRQTAYQTEQSP